MARKKRKVAFYYLTVQNEDISPLAAFREVLDYINSLPREHRRVNLGGNKFCLLDFSEAYPRSTKNKLCIKSATHSFRPNLIHRDTVSERESPKELGEGEIIKTHLITREVNNDLVVLMEKQMDGITMAQFVNYLNHFTPHLERDEQLRFSHEVLLKENFLEEVEQLSRVTSADIIVDKQILGGNALNFSNRINEVKYDVAITVKAKTRDTIMNFVRDVYANLNGGQHIIRKIRVVGRNQGNNEVKINTDFIEKQEFINPEVNETTGELSTNAVFIEMNAIIDNL